ncbi:MAG: hypothetical protein KF791_01055 [Verrucomicrobiae bacterium]|nr:hypothetical protein [Verrucomicrobiae bacterium]
MEPSRPPSLNGQLALILLPVLGLAIAGVVALTRDRVAVEAEARRTAETVAQDLAVRLSRTLPSELSMIELAGNLWLGDGVIGRRLLPWPGSEDPVPAGKLPGRRVVEDVLARYPLPAWEFLPMTIRFDADGRLADPPPTLEVPQPPRWVSQIPADTGQIFGGGSERMPDLEILASRLDDPDFSALIRCERELSRARTASASERIQRLLAVGVRAVQEAVVTATGTPLAVSVFVEARGVDPEASLDADWFSLVQGLVLTQPSFFSPWVLDQALQMTTNVPLAVGRRAVSELAARWRSDQRLRVLAARLSDRVPLMLAPTTNFWIQQGSEAWLVVVHPSESVLMTSSNAVRSSITNTVTAARALPERILGPALERAVTVVSIVDGRDRRIAPSLPAGLTLSIDIEGRPISGIPARWAGVWSNSVPVLAIASGEFLQEAISDQGPSDNWPTRPRFTVRVLLSDAAALFASQRRQLWIFGGMILSTAGVAGIGVWQAHRAFRRQCALAEQKSNFVSSVSHELRAPLASMQLLAERLAGGRVHDDAKRREYAGFLLQETRRLGGLVESILNVARMEQGRQRYEFQPMDVVRWLRETTRLMEPLAGERGVAIVCASPKAGAGTEVWTATWDARAIQQALLNLLDNALKHSPPGSTVRVELERIGPSPVRFHLRVSDEGPGVPAEEHGRIFERFHRRGSELRRETQGIGLGLSIVRHIVEGHGGRVWVESEVGKGAAFHLEIAEHPPGKEPWPGS